MNAFDEEGRLLDETAQNLLNTRMRRLRDEVT
jgi:hypothetical protein